MLGQSSEHQLPAVTAIVADELLTFGGQEMMVESVIWFFCFLKNVLSILAY